MVHVAIPCSVQLSEDVNGVDQLHRRGSGSFRELPRQNYQTQGEVDDHVSNSAFQISRA